MSPALDEALKAAAEAHDMAISPTGAVRRNVGKLRLDLVPPSWVRALARVLGKGAVKYGPRNYEKGLPFTATIASAERHILALKTGEDLDPETGEPHAAMAAWNMLAIVEFQRRIKLGTLPASLDDRPADWRDEHEREHDYKDAGETLDQRAERMLGTALHCCATCANPRSCASWGRCVSASMQRYREETRAQFQGDVAGFAFCRDCATPPQCEQTGARCAI